MTNLLFYKQFTIFNIAIILMILLLNFCFTLFQSNQMLSWLSTLYFAILTFVFFLGGKRTVDHEDSALFSNVFFIVSGLKVLGAIILMWFYVSTYKPVGQYYVFPFILVYILYTIFEIHILTLLAKK